MRISSINNAISGIAKTARRTVAAGMVAASPMAAKAEAAVETVVPRQCATTNTVQMGSWAGLFEGRMKWMGVMDLDWFKVKTNEMARVVNADSISVEAGRVRIGGVGDGDVISAQLLATDDLRKPISEWKVVDFVGREKGYDYDGNSATKWYTEINTDSKNRFFKWRINPKLKRENGDFGYKIIFTDENGNVIPD